MPFASYLPDKSNLNKNEITLLEKFERIMQAEYERVSGNAISESGLKKLLSNYM